MNAPEVKNPRSGFHSVVLNLRLTHVLPLSLEIPSQVSISLLPGSSRLSSQMARNLPDGSEVTHEKYWSLRAGLPAALTLTHRMFDHVFPPSVDVCTEMLAPLLARSRLF